MTVWDPFTHNPYRLLGIPREQGPPRSRETAVVLHVMDLASIEMTDELFEQCLRELASERQPLHRATWFDSTRPLDQLAWLDICEGRPLDAWRRWSSETHLLSAHNLAVLAHLRWLKKPEDLELAKDVSRRWKELAEVTQEPGYLQVIGALRQGLRQRAAELVTRGQSGPLRAIWNLTVLLTSVPEVQAEQMEMLATDLERWNLDMAQLRQALLDGQPVDQITRKFETVLLPQSQFLLQCTADNLEFAGKFRHQLAMFYHQLARGWWDVGEDAARDYAESWLEQAIGLAGPELQESWRADLDHWRVSRRPSLAKPAEMTLIPGEEARAPQRRLGIVIATLCCLALGWAFTHRPRDPMATLTRPAAQQRADQIVAELSPLAEKLAQMPGKIQKAPPAQRKEMEEEQERLQQRYGALKAELVRLQRWLDVH
ncbi:MAG: hypothetical protein KF760_06545 [Candidatus Eremiobacteraeota bacterium]|nr:hypothetical protein [Candidatus Eremiobacteraeota bacterium]MCW5866083.1 hypothetical protein [Candidatus Eremiobacteraeota bacterium]